MLTFLDLSGITPTTRRLLGRRASQNVVSWGDRDDAGRAPARCPLRHGPRPRTRPLRPMFLALLVAARCCVCAPAGMEGTLLTVVQFIPTVALIVVRGAPARHRPLPRRARRERQRVRRGRRAALAERLDDRLEYFGVHVVLHRLAEGRWPRACAPSSRRTARSWPERTVVINLDAVGGGELRADEEGGPAPPGRSSPSAHRGDRTGRRDRRTASRATATRRASAGLPAITITRHERAGSRRTPCRAPRSCASRSPRRIDEELS